MDRCFTSQEHSCKSKSHFDNVTTEQDSLLVTLPPLRTRKCSDLAVLPPIAVNSNSWSRHMDPSGLVKQNATHAGLESPIPRKLSRKESAGMLPDMRRDANVSPLGGAVKCNDEKNMKWNTKAGKKTQEPTPKRKVSQRKVSKISNTSVEKLTTGAVRKTSTKNLSERKRKKSKLSSKGNLAAGFSSGNAKPRRKSEIDQIQLNKFGFDDMIQALDQAGEEIRESYDEGYSEVHSGCSSSLPRLTPPPDWECEYGQQVQQADPDKFGYIPKRCWCNRCQLMYDMHRNKDPDLINWGRYPCYQW